MDFFWIKVALSFCIGGLYIAGSLRLAEKYGSRIGGILVGLPSTTLISVIFIAWTQNAQVALDAIPIIPLSVALSSVFIVLFILFSRYGTVKALVTALLIWFCMTGSLVILEFRDVQVSLLLSIIVFSGTFLFFKRIPDRKSAPIKLTKRQFIGRACLTGSIIALAVILAKFLGPLWGGLFGSFPAAYSSSLVLLTRAHGRDFAASVGKGMAYGSIGIIVFVLGFYYITPLSNVVVGIASGYAAALCFAVCFYCCTVKRG